jgi:ribosomal protein L37AE/L43A
MFWKMREIRKKEDKDICPLCSDEAVKRILLRGSETRKCRRKFLNKKMAACERGGSSRENIKMY